MLQPVTHSQEVNLLQAYQAERSDLLRQQILELHFDLIHPAIREAINQVENQAALWHSPSYLSLLDCGAHSLSEAIEQFNPQFEQSFRLYANSYICEFAKSLIQTEQNGSQQNLIEQNLSQHNSSEGIKDPNLDHESAIQSSSDSSVSKKHKSFRLSSEESQFLQKVAINLNGNSEVEDSESVSNQQVDQLKSQTWTLLKRYQTSPSVELRNQIVNLNLGLARKEAFHWTNQCTEPFEDLLQVGVMGLIRGIERFDCDRQNAFSSFAVPYIRGEIQHYLRDKSTTVRIPRQWLETYNHACRILPQLREQLNREPTSKEVAKALNISISEWQEVRLGCQNRQMISLDSSIGNEEDEGSSLGDLMPDLKYRSFQLAQEDSMRLYHGLSHLEDRTREIIEFVFLKEFTHREVAEILGISAVTVSRQVKKGLEVLKQVMNTPLER
jgi:RNA polymerase sigma-B factor